MAPALEWEVSKQQCLMPREWEWAAGHAQPHWEKQHSEDSHYTTPSLKVCISAVKNCTRCVFVLMWRQISSGLNLSYSLRSPCSIFKLQEFFFITGFILRHSELLLPISFPPLFLLFFLFLPIHIVITASISLSRLIPLLPPQHPETVKDIIFLLLHNSIPPLALAYFSLFSSSSLLLLLGLAVK